MADTRPRSNALILRLAFGRCVARGRWLKGDSESRRAVRVLSDQGRRATVAGWEHAHGASDSRERSATRRVGAFVREPFGGWCGTTGGPTYSVGEWTRSLAVFDQYSRWLISRKYFRRTRLAHRRRIDRVLV
jgi:hypothetical protein